MIAKRLLCFLASLCLLVCSVGAVGTDVGDSESPSSDLPAVQGVGLSSGDIAVAVSQALTDVVSSEPVEILAYSVPLVDTAGDDSGISPQYDLDNGQTSEPAGTLKAILVKLIGPYNPVVVEYRYQNYNQSTYSYVREIQPDYVWFGAAGLFALMVYCCFRLGGGLLRRT